MVTHQQQIEMLTRINIQDMLDNCGVSQLQRGRGLLEWLCASPARLFARQVARLDQRVGEVGLQVAAAELLMRYIHRLDVVGAAHVPQTDGVIFAANHPGMTDTLACFTSIVRTDLHVVSADRPFVRALPQLSRRMFYVKDEANERLTIVRQIARFLQGGGAVLICPAGQIEPDPAVMSGAVESLQSWSDSLGLFVRLAPDVVVVPTVVSGVVYAPALHNPLTRLRRAPKDRERMAATIQVFLLSIGYLQPRMTVRIEFGTPLRAAELVSLGDAATITRAITDAVRQILLRIK